MKLIISITVTLLFIGCGASKQEVHPQSLKVNKVQVYPQWYQHRELQSAVKYEMIGYGQGKTIKEAEANAKEDIAQILTSKVDSKITSETSTFNNEYSSKTKATLKVTSKLNLHNVKNIKQEQIDNIFYVALKYKNLDLAYRIISAVGKVECSHSKSNSYLSQTPLIKKLTASIGCELNFKLDRRNEAWYLKYKEHLFLLSDSEFEELYTSKSNDSFEFKSNKRVLTDGDSFFFNINTKKEGYITLLDVYENGIVTVIQLSTPIKKSLQIPSKDSENYFEAGLVKENENTFDLYVAIYTKEPLDMSRFEYVNEELAESELAYKFDELIGVMDQVEYSSLLLRTKARKR